MKSFVLAFGTVILAFFTAPIHTNAQGLIWSLPEDGTLVRYKGVYKQFIRRPDSTDGDLTLTWDRILEIRSVGQESGMYQGKEVPCRWIEFKIETGNSPEGVLDAGPGATRMYKLLVPELTIRGTVDKPILEREGTPTIFASHIEIVKGFRRIGDEPTKELDSKVFQLYPIVSLLRHYPDLNEGATEDLNTIAGEFNATKWTGEVKMETNVYRSTNAGEVSRSETMPFGVVAWKAKTIVEEKGSTDAREAFLESTIIDEEMTVIAIEENAESEFLVN